MKIRQTVYHCIYKIFFPPGILAVIVATAAFFPATAQILGDDYTIKEYSAENGLPQNTVRAIQTDRKGFVWLGTEFGLVRFDGENFKVYNTENTPAIKSNRINFIGKNLSGEVFIIDGQSFISLINEKENSIDSLGVYQDNTKYIISGKEVIATKDLISEDSSSRITFKKLFDPAVFTNPVFFPATGYYCPISDSTGYAIVKNTGIIYITKEGLKKVSDWIPSVNLPIYFRKNGALYVYEGNSFIEIKNGYKTNSSFTIAGDFIHTNYYSNKPSSNILFSNNQDSLVLFMEGAVYTMAIKNNKLETKMVLRASKPDIMSFTYLPAWDTYILGTATDGMQVLQKKRFSVLTLKSVRSDANNFYAQSPVNGSTILTHMGILDIHKRKIVKPMSLNRYSMLTSKANLLYYAQDYSPEGYSPGIHIVDTSLTELRKYFGLVDVRGLVEDSLGRIWFGLYDKLYRTSPADSLKSVLLIDKGLIETIFPYNNTTLWLGTRQGIYEYNINSNSLTIIKSTENLYARNIYRSKDGNIWIGTYGQGFYLFKNRQFIKMPPDENQYLTTAHCFIEDANGFFWIPTNKGLFQVLIRELYDFASGKTSSVYYYYYDRNSGFNTNEFNGGCVPCSLTFNDGTVSLPSMNGLVWFNPVSVKALLPGNEILIDKVDVNNSEVSYTNDQLQLPANTKNITVELYTPFFGHKNNLQFEYRFSLNDTTWEKIILNKIILTNLSSGKHLLTIRNRTGFGSGAYAYKQLAIIIEKKWYEQLGYHILAGLLLLAVIIGLSGLRSRLIRKKNKDLEKQITRRTEELNNAMEKLNHTVEELQASQKELQKSNDLKDKLTSILAHDLRSSVRFTSTLSSHLHKKLTARQYDENLTQITSDLAKTTQETYLFIEEFLVWISSQRLQYRVHRELLDIERFMQELQNFFEEVVKLNENKIYFKVESNEEIITDRQILKIIVRNLIDNSNKYTKSGNIYVTGRSQDDKYIIVIKDTGKGMAQKEIEKLVNPNAEEVATSKGLGYKIIIDLIELIHVKISIESVLNEGTAVSLEIPLKPQASIA